MQAVIQQRYGAPERLQLADIPDPVPADNEVRVRIGASAVTAADTMMRRGTPWFGRLFTGLFKPKHTVTGTGFSGVVDIVGKEVTTFTVGDRVYGESVLGAGTHCEYVCVPAAGVIDGSPAELTDDQLAPVCDGLLTSYHFIFNVACVKPGQRILINGAAGSLGCAAVQFAKLAGAQVTAVCSSDNIRFVLELGADDVIDYTTADFTRVCAPFDVIYDAVGRRSYRDCRSVLKAQGMYMSPVLSCGLLRAMLWSHLVDRPAARFAATGLLPEPDRRAMLQKLTRWLASGEVRAVTEHLFRIDAVADAHHLIDTGHRRSNVALMMTG